MAESFRNSSDHGPSVTFYGPANWFSFAVPAGIEVDQTEAFVELKPKSTRDNGHSSQDSNTPPPWSLTLYSAWVDTDEPETHAATFDPAGLFPRIVRSQREDRLPLPAQNRAWSGHSRHPSSQWWTKIFRRRSTYQWQLWVIEYEPIILVASLQSRSGYALSDETISACTAALSSLSFAETLARPPELFRQDVLRLARKHFPLLSTESSGAFGIKVAESDINLANFYRSYLQDPTRLREIVLPGLTTVVRLQELGPEQLMPPLETVADRIMPMLYADSDADATLEGFVRVPWVGGLSIMFVLDEDDTYRFVHTKMLQTWSLSEDELRTMAMDNLERFSRDNPLEVTLVGEQDDPRMLVPVEPNAYNSVRLLGGHLHQRLRQLLGPELIVGLPNRDFFVAVSIDHPRLVGQVQQRVLQDYQSMHHPLTSQLLVISADGVSEYCES